MIWVLLFYTLIYMYRLKTVAAWKNLSLTYQDKSLRTNSALLFLPYIKKVVLLDNYWWSPKDAEQCRFLALLIVPLYNTNLHNRNISVPIADRKSTRLNSSHQIISYA